MSYRWGVWWRLLRPFTLTAAVMPVLIGTAFAFTKVTMKDGSFFDQSVLDGVIDPFYSGLINLPVFGAMLLASVLIQAATNMFNEYYDFKRGLDTAQSVGISGTIVRDGVHEKVVFRLGMTFFAVAILLGVYICLKSSWWVAVVGSFSMAVGYFYTGGRYPLAYTPFGELAAVFFMGPVIVMLAYFIHTGEVNLSIFLISIPISTLVGAILMANNIRDLDQDKAKGRRTLAILLGRKKAIHFLSGMFVFAYVWVMVLIAMGLASWWTLLTLLAVPRAVTSMILFHKGRTPPEWMPAMKSVAQLHAQFGLLFALGLIIESVLN